jgi:HupE/UreJ protein
MRRALGLLLLAMSWVTSAAAHVTSTGLATLEVDGGKLVYRLTVVTTEVDDQGGRLLAEAADGDRSAAERVAGFLRDYARFSLAGEPCLPGRIAIRGSSAGEGKVVLEMALSCPKPGGTLAIRDDWPEVLGAHFQTVLSVRVPERPSVEFAFLEDRRSAFTVAHSVTLSLASLGLVDVPARIVEPLIAASIVWVAVENLVAPAGVGRRWLIAAIFGLVHGLGFASALTELDLSRQALVRALIGFNVGVELGQLAFVAAVMPPLIWASRPGRLARLPQALSVIVAAAGAVWLISRLLAV